RRRPDQHALGRRHQGAQSGDLATKHADVRRCKPQSNQLAPLEAAPAGADAARQQPAHETTKRPIVEIAKVDYVGLHRREARPFPQAPPAFTRLPGVRAARARRLNSRRPLLGCFKDPKKQAKAPELSSCPSSKFTNFPVLPTTSAC